jgi:hypothetical protein
MSYSNKNLLLRMVKIQDTVLEHKKRGVPQIHVYRNVIAPEYNISYSTFNRYLSYPAKLELSRRPPGRKKASRL